LFLFRFVVGFDFPWMSAGAPAEFTAHDDAFQVGHEVMTVLAAVAVLLSRYTVWVIAGNVPLVMVLAIGPQPAVDPVKYPAIEDAQDERDKGD
jgi:hypothetical protein